MQSHERADHRLQHSDLARESRFYWWSGRALASGELVLRIPRKGLQYLDRKIQLGADLPEAGE
jgi:hypothetical protein